MTKTSEEISQWLARQIDFTVQTNWQIKTVERSDFEAVKNLFLKLHDFNTFLDPYFALSSQWESYFGEYMEHALKCQRCLCLVARNTQDNRPVGFVLAAVQQESAMWQHRDWVEIVALYVEQETRGQGLSEKLLEPVYKWIRFLGLTRLQLYVTATNERALHFYKKNDFRAAQNIVRKMV